MNRIIFSTTFLNFQIIFLHSLQVETRWLNFLTNQITKKVQPYQMTYFTTNISKYTSDKENAVIKHLVKETLIPVYSVENFSFDNKTFLTSSLFLRHVSMNIVFDTLECKYSKMIVDIITEISPISLRPQILVIIFHSNIIQKLKIDQILQYAWRKKFLDFTILTVDADGNEVYSKKVFYNWNPFSNFLSETLLDSNVQIFPNKMLNLLGHPMKLPIANFPPFLQVVKLKNKVIRVTGLYYPFLKFILKTMNFTLRFGFEIDFYSDASIDYFTYTRLQNRDENMMTVTSPIHLSDKVIVVEIDYIFRELVVIVPIISTTKFNIPRDIFIYSFAIPTVIICFLYVLQFLKIISAHWRVFKIIQLLLGVTVSTKFKTTDVSIIYSCVIILSVAYTNNLYSNILDVNLERSEMSFKTFVEIDESDLAIFINRIHFDRFYETNNTKKHMKNMMKKTQKVEEISECVQSIADGKKVICITTNWHAKYFEKKYRIAQKRIFKVIRLPVVADKIGYMFEPASPFAERFDEIQRKVLESGIWFKLFSDDVTAGKRKNYNIFDERFSILKLLPIILVGYFLACLTFFIEYINR